MLFSVNFADLTINDSILNLLIIAACCVGAVFCTKAVARGYGLAVKLLVILLVLAALVANWLGRYPGIDETEHLHATWLISQGLLPFRDFFQHHSPLFWLLFAPLVKLVPHTGVICDFGRITSLLISTGAWCLAGLLIRRVHPPARGSYYVLALLGVCACGIGQFNAFRPDLPANVMTMGAVLVLMTPRLRWRMLLSGVLLGLAFALTPKHYFFFGLLPLLYAREIVLLLRQRLAPLATRRCWVEMARRPLADWCAPALREWRGSLTLASLREVLTSPAPLPALCMHYIGVALGLVPLFLWLFAHRLIPQFMFWCLQFNQMQAPMNVGGDFPLLFPLIFGVWLLQARVYQWATLAQEKRILAIGTLLGALIFFTYTKSVYNAQMFLILASVAGTGVIRDFFARCVASKQSWVCGGCVGLALLSYPQLTRWLQSQDYLDGRREIALLNQVSGQGPVIGVTPRHPIFTRDATDVYHPAQWGSFIFDYTAVCERLQNIDQQIFTKRPTVIFCGESLVLTNKPYPLSPEAPYYFVDHLWYARALNVARAARLQAYIEQHYQLILFVRHYYWVRNDLVTADLPAPYHAPASIPVFPAWAPPPMPGALSPASPTVTAVGGAKTPQQY